MHNGKQTKFCLVMHWKDSCMCFFSGLIGLTFKTQLVELNLCCLSLYLCSHHLYPFYWIWEWISFNPNRFTNILDMTCEATSKQLGGLRRVMLIMSWDLQIRDVNFAGDCLHVIEVANHEKPLDAELFSVIHDIHCLMELAPSWKIVFIYRAANRTAHLLAKSACTLDEDQVWLEDIPSFISDVLRRRNNVLIYLMNETSCLFFYFYYKKKQLRTWNTRSPSLSLFILKSHFFSVFPSQATKKKTRISIGLCFKFRFLYVLTS